MGKIPPARRFPKRLSQQELKDSTSAYMNKLGADNHYKAMYYQETAEEVVGMKSQMFFSIQPDLHHTDYKNESWNICYRYVLEFLNANQMFLTVKAIKKELGSAGLPPETDIFDSDNLYGYFEQLIGVSKDLKHFKFKDRVIEWKEADQKGLEGEY